MLLDVPYYTHSVIGARITPGIGAQQLQIAGESLETFTIPGMNRIHVVHGKIKMPNFDYGADKRQ